MNSFLKVVAVNDREVNKYLEEGWELIDTTSEAYGDGGYFLKYHLGLPAQTVMHRFKDIIDTYEKYGLKEQLFKKVAESNGRTYEEYSDSPDYRRTKDDTTDFMESYEKIVHDKTTVYYRKGDKDAEVHF